MPRASASTPDSPNPNGQQRGTQALPYVRIRSKLEQPSSPSLATTRPYTLGLATSTARRHAAASCLRGCPTIQPSQRLATAHRVDPTGARSATASSCKLASSLPLAALESRARGCCGQRRRVAAGIGLAHPYLFAYGNRPLPFMLYYWELFLFFCCGFHRLNNRRHIKSELYKPKKNHMFCIIMRATRQRSASRHLSACLPPPMHETSHTTREAVKWS